MKNPFNILNGTILVIVLSIVGLILLIIFSQSLDFGLTQENYYEQGLKYQQQIERIERTKALSESVKISLEKSILLIEFPELFVPNNVIGKIHFFRPSNPSLDKILPLELSENGIQKIDLSDFLNGLWIVKLYWSNKDLEYYMEKRIFINNN
jgi:hypothetical protein